MLVDIYGVKNSTRVLSIQVEDRTRISVIEFHDREGRKTLVLPQRYYRGIKKVLDDPVISEGIVRDEVYMSVYPTENGPALRLERSGLC